MDGALKELRATGRAILDPLPPRQIAELNAYLEDCDVYSDAHVPEHARSRGDYPVSRAMLNGSECFCVHTDDAILAPHLFERALALTDVAAAYLAVEPPVMYSANAFWTRPGSAPLRGDIQAYHKDADDPRFVALFCYLTDVLTCDDGPQDLQGPDGIIRTTFGCAGTLFLADTSRNHRGRKPTTKERGIAWFRWGITARPQANIWDGIEPVPARLLGPRYPSDTRLRQSIQLLVN
jgi:hypothetical protein